MRKSDFIEFLDKYYLNGVLTKDASNSWLPVPIQVNEKVASVSVKSGDKSMLMVIDFNLDLPDGEFIVGDTAALKTILSAFDDNLELTLKSQGQKYVNVMQLSDGVVNGTFALADPIQVEERHGLKTEPQYDCSFKVNKQFTDRFLKAQKALKDSTMFAVLPNDFNSTLEFVVNYSSDKNVNSIKVPVNEVLFEGQFDLLYFSSSNFGAVLQENTEYREATISLSGMGLMKVNFKGEDYEANYYLSAYRVDGE